MARVLGLDLSLRATGACILEGDLSEKPECKTKLFRQGKADTVETRTLRLVAIAEDVLGFFEAERPDLVVIEAPAKDQKYQSAAIGELHGVIRTQLFLAFGVHPMVKESTMLRKMVVGKIERKFEEVVTGNGKKKRRVTYGMVRGKSGKMKRATIKDVIEVRLRGEGWEFPSQDEMDAYVAARYGWNELVSFSGCVTDEQGREDDERAQPGVA